MTTVLALTGNPRPASRSHILATTLASAIAAQLGAEAPAEIDLALLGQRVFDNDDALAREAAEQVLAAEVLVVSSPTYKATYSGLLKVFLDRFSTGSLAGAAAVPILLGGAPNHLLAVDVHFTPLLLELGASVPARGLFVLESELNEFAAFAAEWAAHKAAKLLAVSRR
jgi:FMN reductase